MSAEVAASPRTPAEPMAFTRAEFWRGAYAAWWMYLIALVICCVASGGGYGVAAVPYALLIGGPIALVAMYVFSPLAYVLGRSLRRVSAPGCHLLLFGMLGLITGVATMGVFGLVGGLPPGSGAFFWIFAAPAGLTVPFGWWFTARQALRRDRRHEPRPDIDAAYEDAR